MQTFTCRDWFVSVRKLAHVAKRGLFDAWPDNKALMVSRAALVVVLASASFGTYWFYGRAIGALSVATSRPRALWYIIAALTVSFFIDLVRVLDSWSERLLWHRFLTKFNLLYLTRKGALGIDTLENPDFRDVVTRAEERGVWSNLNVVDGQFVNLGNLTRLLVALAIVGTFDWRLCLLVCVALLPQFFVDISYGTTLWSIFDAETETRRRFNELHSHIRIRSRLVELKLFQNVEYFINRIRAILEDFQHSQEKAERKRHYWAALAVTASALIISAVMVIVIRRVIIGSIPIGRFVFLWGSTQSLHSALGGTLKAIAQQNEWALHAADNYAVIDARPEMEDMTGEIICPNRVPTIIFDRVSFSYPWDSPDRVILKEVSLTIRPGETTALVGINGAGKTTLIKLLCGIYRPTDGKILIDGIDLTDIDTNSWRRQLAVLFQNYSDYHMTVREAIAIGDTSEPVDEERLLHAAITGGADNFVSALPRGYNTMIGKDFADGVDLSGGQHQRMALARVFYRQGRVIVLDEPTASLDAFGEQQIFEELEDPQSDASLILITHRFSTIKNADHIVVLDQGTVVEDGNHQKLIGQNGLYAEMFWKQARGYDIEPILVNEQNGK